MPLALSDKDSWKTPLRCLRELEPFIDWSKVHIALDPCSGDGRIGKWITTQSDKIITHCNEPCKGGTDFLRDSFPITANLLLTNPPYSLAQEFVEKGFLVSYTSCWLLSIRFLNSKQRKRLYEKNPLNALYVLTKRPAFEMGPSNRVMGTANDEYAWFIWDKLGIFKKHGIVHL